MSGFVGVSMGGWCVYVKGSRVNGFVGVSMGGWCVYVKGSRVNGFVGVNMGGWCVYVKEWGHMEYILCFICQIFLSTTSTTISLYRCNICTSTNEYPVEPPNSLIRHIL